MELTIGELASLATHAVEAASVRGANGRVTERPDARTIRYYATLGLLDRPAAFRGRTALYGERHLLQLVAIKRRQAEGRALAAIQEELAGATDRTLRTVAALPTDLQDQLRDGRVPSVVPAAAVTDEPAAEPAGRSFWREPLRGGGDLLYGVPLGDGVVLTLPVTPSTADLDAVREAARPLLALLAQRRLTRPHDATAAKGGIR